MKEKLLISACLMGLGCRYDGKELNKIDITPLLERYELIPICPEIYGGLPTPRTPSERVGERVVMKDGRDVTQEFHRGGEAACRLALLTGARKALLKEKSPSCGSGKIYDGSFTGRLTDGFGVAAEMLAAAGVAVYGESELPRLLGE